MMLVHDTDYPNLFLALMLTEWHRLVHVEQRNVPLVIGLVAVDVELCAAEAFITYMTSKFQECLLGKGRQPTSY